MRSSLFKAGVVLGACLLAVPAQAAPVAVPKTLPVPDSYSNLIQVQHHHGGHGGGGGHHGGGGGGGGGWGGGGGAVAAGVIGGLIVGAIIAGEAQRQQAASYCARRYRSYDPYSRTFVGRDGRRYHCG